MFNSVYYVITNPCSYADVRLATTSSNRITDYKWTS